MRSLHQQLSNYATYHRDVRNIATHFVGIPMIMVAAYAFLAKPTFELGGFALSPALIGAAIPIVFYFAVDVRYGLAMLVFTSGVVWTGMLIASQSTAIWAITASSLFIVGWIFQLVGHVFEGRKPAFMDDITGLLVGPLFVVAEVGFMIGLRGDVRSAIEAVAGPTRRRSSLTA
jgi:uncharacterized membrane protein YGL010W